MRREICPFTLENMHTPGGWASIPRDPGTSLGWSPHQNKSPAMAEAPPSLSLTCPGVLGPRPTPEPRAVVESWLAPAASGLTVLFPCPS